MSNIPEGFVPVNRKIIQIAVDSSSSEDPADDIGSLYALCDDGTIWTKTSFGNKEWKQIDTTTVESG